MTETIQRVRLVTKRVVNWFLGLSTLQRSIIISLIGAFNISLVFGAVNSLALYIYAYSENIRFPVEGVPYVRVAIVTTTFYSFALGGAVAAIFWSFYRWLEGLSQAEASPPIEKFTRWLAIIAPLIGLLATSTGLVRVLAHLAGATIVTPLPNIGDYREDLAIGLREAMLTTTTALVAAVSAMALWAALKTLRHRRLRISPYSLAGFGLGIVIPAIAVVFHPQIYGTFLREIGFGGGTPVRVSYRSTDGQVEEISGGLLLMTNTNIVLRVEPGDGATEIPRDRISKIDYLSGS